MDDNGEDIPNLTLDEMIASLAASEADIKAGRVVLLEDVLAMLQASADRLFAERETSAVIESPRRA